MFFALSKTLDFLLHPINLLGIFSIASVVFFLFNRRKLAKLLGISVIGEWLLVGFAIPGPRARGNGILRLGSWPEFLSTN